MNRLGRDSENMLWAGGQRVQKSTEQDGQTLVRDTTNKASHSPRKSANPPLPQPAVSGTSDVRAEGGDEASARGETMIGDIHAASSPTLQGQSGNMPCDEGVEDIKNNGLSVNHTTSSTNVDPGQTFNCDDSATGTTNDSKIHTLASPVSITCQGGTAPIMTSRYCDMVAGKGTLSQDDINTPLRRQTRVQTSRRQSRDSTTQIPGGANTNNNHSKPGNSPQRKTPPETPDDSRNRKLTSLPPEPSNTYRTSSSKRASLIEAEEHVRPEARNGADAPTKMDDGDQEAATTGDEFGLRSIMGLLQTVLGRAKAVSSEINSTVAPDGLERSALLGLREGIGGLISEMTVYNVLIDAMANDTPRIASLTQRYALLSCRRPSTESSLYSKDIRPRTDEF
jgi:hypothetical protein